MSARRAATTKTEPSGPKLTPEELEEIAQGLAEFAPSVPAPNPKPDPEPDPQAAPAPAPTPEPKTSGATLKPDADRQLLTPDQSAQVSALALLLKIEEESKLLRAAIANGKRPVHRWGNFAPLQFFTLHLARLLINVYAQVDSAAKVQKGH